MSSRELWSAVLSRAPRRWRAWALARRTLAFWRARRRLEGGLANAHFEASFTRLFGLTADDYAGACVLDVGCGPRGSLEWAHRAKERVGLDPLADRFFPLGPGAHAMRYVKGAAERMPFEDGRFDIVTAFNMLDHTADPDAAIAEIERVTRVGGRILVLVALDPRPSPGRLALDAGLAARFRRSVCVDATMSAARADGDLYRAAHEARPAPGPDGRAVLRLRLERRADA